MSITPSADFWPQPITLDIQGVTAANAPLSVSGGTVTISPASISTQGIVTTDAQSFSGVKTFSSGLAIAAGPTITYISTDGTFGAVSDAGLSTQKAVKTYVDASTLSSTCSLPLEVQLDDLRIVNTGGAKITSVTTSITLSGDSDLAIPTEHAVKTYVDASPSGITATAPIYKTISNLDLRNSSGAQITAVRVSTGIIPAPLHTMIATEKSMTEYVGTYVSEHALRSAALPLAYSLPGGVVSLINDSFQQVTTVSTDGTMVANSNLQLPTQAAVVSYVAAYGPVATASAPLSIVSRDVRVADASGLASGVVNIASQSFAGLKTFKNGANALAPSGVVSTAQPQFTVGNTPTITSSIGVSPTGATTITSQGTIYTDTGSVLSTAISSTGVRTFLPTTVPELMVVNTSSGATIDLQTFADFSSTMIVPTGTYTMTQGPKTVLSSVSGVTTIPQTLEIAGEMKLHQPAVQIILTGAGPFDNVPLANGASLFVFDCTGATSNAHITGFAATTYTACRIVYLVFLHPTSINLILDNLSASSLPSARVMTYRGNATTLRIEPQDCLQLLYNPYHSKWIVMGHEY
jgi:hypothetical protein